MSEVDQNAKIIWDYMLMHQKLQKADAIFALGSHDVGVGKYAAQLFLDGWAPLLIVSGGVGRITEAWKKPEAEIFAEVAIQMGVPEEKIIVESKSTNTGENIKLTLRLLKKKEIKVQKLILVQKPYMERRAYATFKKQSSEIDIIVTSPPISFEEYLPADRPKEEWIHILTGDLQRIKIYADKGFMIRQDIPSEVWDAYKKLVDLGYAKHILED